MRSRPLKIAAGLLAATAAGYVLLGEQLAGVSADAVINAQITTIRAPIDGELSLKVWNVGARLRANELIATVTDPRPDDKRLVDLQRTALQVSADLARLRHLEGGLNEALSALQDRAYEYQRGRVQQLESKLSEAKALYESTQARLRESDATLRRSNDLARSGFQSIADLNKARSNYEVGAQDAQGALDRIRFLAVELQSARHGTFIGDSYNDTPYSTQRLGELNLRLTELATDVADREHRLLILKQQVEEERVRVIRFRDARLSAPSHSVLWEVMSGGGEYVHKAQDLVRLVDCSSSMVTASVRESLYNRLKVGDIAQFRLRGDSRVFEGSVARLAGSGAESIYRSLAVGPSQEHLKRFDVALVFPTLSQSFDVDCAIGRTGKVVFSSRPLDFWRRLLIQSGLF